MVAPGHIAFNKDGMGQLHFGCVETELDWRFEADTQRVEFTLSGFDARDEVTGPGWAKGGLLCKLCATSFGFTIFLGENGAHSRT